MKIISHKLEKEHAAFIETKKTSGNFKAGRPDILVIHYTGSGNLESAVSTFLDPSVSASAHVLVDKNGQLTQMVPFNKVAWHAGRSTHFDRTGLNRYSIGIEVVNAGRLTPAGKSFVSWFGRKYPEEEAIQATHRNESEAGWWEQFTEAQIDSVFRLCKVLIATYPIKYIVGHEEISPGRKIDPGPAFPLDKLREKLLSGSRKDDTPAEEKTPEKGVVNATALNIRSGPSAQRETVAPALTRNTPLKILGKENGWYRVETKITGWVAARFVKPEN